MSLSCPGSHSTESGKSYPACRTQREREEASDDVHLPAHSRQDHDCLIGQFPELQDLPLMQPSSCPLARLTSDSRSVVLAAAADGPAVTGKRSISSPSCLCQDRSRKDGKAAGLSLVSGYLRKTELLIPYPKPGSQVRGRGQWEHVSTSDDANSEFLSVVQPPDSRSLSALSVNTPTLNKKSTIVVLSVQLQSPAVIVGLWAVGRGSSSP